MPARWLPAVLDTIRGLAAQGNVRFTVKALEELGALDLGIDHQDVCHILAHLATRDFVERLVSNQNGEWMYVFRPTVAHTPVYLKLVLRDNCVVISCHEDHESDQIGE